MPSCKQIGESELTVQGASCLSRTNRKLDLRLYSTFELLDAAVGDEAAIQKATAQLDHRVAGFYLVAIQPVLLQIRCKVPQQPRAFHFDERRTFPTAGTLRGRCHS